VFFKRDVLLAQEYLGFLLLNMFDLFLTRYILRAGGLEANGPANWFWVHFGFLGFAMYKFGLVMIVVLACEGISLSNIRTSRLIVTMGCLVYLLIVFWEVFLIITQTNGLQL
jgi:hypothetical protein